jgi:hypothetical protein
MCTCQHATASGSNIACLHLGAHTDEEAAKAGKKQSKKGGDGSKPAEGGASGKGEKKEKKRRKTEAGEGADGAAKEGAAGAGGEGEGAQRKKQKANKTPLGASNKEAEGDGAKEGDKAPAAPGSPKKPAPKKARHAGVLRPVEVSPPSLFLLHSQSLHCMYGSWCQHAVNGPPAMVLASQGCTASLYTIRLLSTPVDAVCMQEEEKHLKPGTMKHLIFTVLMGAEDQVGVWGAQDVFWHQCGRATNMHMLRSIAYSLLNKLSAMHTQGSLQCVPQGHLDMSAACALPCCLQLSGLTINNIMAIAKEKGLKVS